MFTMFGMTDDGTVVVEPSNNCMVYMGSVSSWLVDGTANSYPGELLVLDGTVTDVPIGKFSGMF